MKATIIWIVKPSNLVHNPNPSANRPNQCIHELLKQELEFPHLPMQRFLRDRKGVDQCALIPVFAGFANAFLKQDSVREIKMVSDGGGIDNAYGKFENLIKCSNNQHQRSGSAAHSFTIPEHYLRSTNLEQPNWLPICILQFKLETSVRHLKLEHQGDLRRKEQ